MIISDYIPLQEISISRKPNNMSIFDATYKPQNEFKEVYTASSGDSICRPIE